MAVTTDATALNEWVPCAYADQLAPGGQMETMVLGQPIRLSRAADGSYACTTLENGQAGRDLPVDERFTCIFTTLGDKPRPLPIIKQFDESDRKIANSGSVGVNACPYRIVENFLDMAHFCFVHTDILGAPDKTEVYAYKTEHRQDVDEIWAIDCSFYQPAASKQAEAEGGGQITQYQYRVMSPFSVMLYKTVYNNEDRLDAICLFIQPKTETECIAYMPMAIVDEQSSMSSIVDFQQTIFLQDRIILENQRPRLLPLDPKKETPTRADVSSVAFRRWLKGMGMRFGILERQAV